ncbi:hypothetical protein F4803DRAFT_514921, partial [Xylaria telfairii]
MAMTGFFYQYARPRTARPMSMLKYDPVGMSSRFYNSARPPGFQHRPFSWHLDRVEQSPSSPIFPPTLHGRPNIRLSRVY